MRARGVVLLALALAILAPCLVGVAGAVTPSWNMVSYYRFETQSCGPGAFALDEDGGIRGAHNMQTQGGFSSPTDCTQTGEYGNAWTFGRSSSAFVHSGQSFGIEGGNSFTMMAWINPTSVGANGARIASAQFNGTELFMRLTPTTFHLDTGIFVGGGCTLKDIIDTGAIPFNSWTNVGMTYDGTVFRQYINGVQTSTLAATGNLCTSAGNSNIGGEFNPGITEPFAGRIDDFRVYSIPLSATEFLSAVNDATNTPSSPAAVWHQADPTSQGSFAAGCDIYTPGFCSPNPNPTALVAGHTYYWVSGTEGVEGIVNAATPRFDLNGWTGSTQSSIAEVRWDDAATCAQNLVVGNYQRTLFFASNTSGGNDYKTWGACQFVATQNFTNVSMQFTVNGNGIPGTGNAMNTWTQSGTSGRVATFLSSGNVVGFLYDANLTTPPAPGNVTLTGVTACVVSPFTNTLAWSAPASGTATSFLLTRTEAWGASQTFQLGASTFTYQDGATTNVRNYTVQAVNAGGSSPPSNVVSLVCPTQSFFGGGASGGAIYGLPGTRAAIQSAFNMSADQVDTLFSIMWVFAFMFIGALLGGMIGGWPTAGSGAVLGAAFGVFWDIAALLIPPWLLIFFGVMVVAVPLGLAMLKRSKP